jgi:hypothetical protein
LGSAGGRLWVLGQVAVSGSHKMPDGTAYTQPSEYMIWGLEAEPRRPLSWVSLRLGAGLREWDLGAHRSSIRRHQDMGGFDLALETESWGLASYRPWTEQSFAPTGWSVIDQVQE